MRHAAAWRRADGDVADVDARAVVTVQTVVFLAVVGARFLVPLLIPRFPLPAIIACLVLDGVDQSIFQAFGYDPPGYQSYDKAMDVFYLAIAYLSTLRNWTSRPAFRVARFLFFYRLVGVVAFELTQSRALLLVFPNTFEYFFIAYEVVRLRWDPRAVQHRFWVVTAGCIWIFVKLPQEYWIHVAQLDFTDQLALHPALGPTIVVLLVVAAAAYWWLLRPRLSPPTGRCGSPPTRCLRRWRPGSSGAPGWPRMGACCPRRPWRRWSWSA